MSSTASKCADCGTLIPDDAPLGQCPICLMNSASGFLFENDGPVQELPRTCGDYELLRQVGCGGMGIVYEARQTRLKRRVALKMVRPDLASRKFLRRFLIEGEAAARLEHPNIIPIYEIKEDGTESFFSMPFIDGETLKEKIQRKEIGFLTTEPPVPADECRRRERLAAQLIADVARGVHHAHERGVFHRDLKPGNILIDHDGKPHIADFGVAKIVSQEERAEAQSTLTVPGAMLGTPEYMAPEQASGAGFVETRTVGAADIYSLGAILYELLTGRPPFRGNSNLETLQKVREGEFKRPRSINPRIPRDLETICLKCLEKNPYARYATAEAVANDLERWLAGEPIQARPASLPARAQRWIKRNPVGTALIVSLFFGLSTALGFLVALSEQIKTANMNKAIERGASLQKFNDLWAFPSVTNLVIPSELLAGIRDDKPRQFVEGRDVRIKFGLGADHSPLSRAHSAAALFGELERRMGLELQRNLFIDVQMSKTTHNEAQPLSARESDVQRLDALTYIRAHALDPDIVPMAIENDADEIVFCVLQNSGITNLAQLAGKNIGFGDADSSATILAQDALLAHGIRAADLKPIRYLTNIFLVSTNRLLDFGSAEITTDMREIKSGREALRYLLEGKVDAAVTLKRYFELRRHRGAGLRMIGRADGMPEVFATHAGLKPDVREALARSMVALRETPALGILSSFRTVSALIATNDSYFDGLRLALTNVQQRFATDAAPSVQQTRASLH